MGNFRENLNDPEETLRILGDAVKGRIWTAIPAIILSYDADAQTVAAQPAVQRINLNSGATVDIAPLLDLPVHFPSGGGMTLTFPVTAGDECLVVFSSRAIDNWWQSGGVQAPSNRRTHDLSDGFAFVGFRSQPRRLTGVSGSAMELRTDDGAVSFSLGPGGIHVKGTITSDNDIIAQGISLVNHVHTEVSTGAENSGPPLP